MWQEVYTFEVDRKRKAWPYAIIEILLTVILNLGFQFVSLLEKGK